MSTIVVFGATGYAGSAITREALSRGHHVVGVARDTSALEPAEGLTVESGSIHDTAFVDRVSAGADVLVIGLPAREIDGHLLIEAVPHVLEVAERVGARVGVVGGASTLLVAEGGPRLLDTPEFPDAYKDEATKHSHVLELLRESATGADWFYVSPAASFGSYNPGERTGSYRVGGEVLLTDADGNSDVSGADFAIAVVDEIERPAHHQERFGVAY